MESGKDERAASRPTPSSGASPSTWVLPDSGEAGLLPDGSSGLSLSPCPRHVDPGAKRDTGRCRSLGVPQGHSQSRGTGEAGGTGLAEQETAGPGPPSRPDPAACPTPWGAGRPPAPEVASS